ncbi:SDR family oxidoreductase [Pareuzebyella sediminis]|uniref:SDR family oxidoreductase n=1 Tax=Pareuzebyella sediminis TaxID=2607998 RepID=UPI0011EF49DB|nr:SDR family oxidoreductase [Pareuzebyella sediminis]
MENVLIAGANGTTGRKIVQLLKNSRDYNPVAMVRKESQMEKFEKENIMTVLGDLEKDISHTVQNIDKIIFAAGSSGKKVIKVDQEGAKKLIDAAKDSSVKKFVMLSSMGADQPEEASDLKEYLKAKHEADEWLKSSDLCYTIVRPGSLTDNQGTGNIKLAQSLGHSGSIAREDVAQTLVGALHDDIANKQVFEIVEGEVVIRKALESISKNPQPQA